MLLFLLFASKYWDCVKDIQILIGNNKDCVFRLRDTLYLFGTRKNTTIQSHNSNIHQDKPTNIIWRNIWKDEDEKIFSCIFTSFCSDVLYKQFDDFLDLVVADLYCFYLWSRWWPYAVPWSCLTPGGRLRQPALCSLQRRRYFLRHPRKITWISRPCNPWTGSSRRNGFIY